MSARLEPRLFEVVALVMRGQHRYGFDIVDGGQSREGQAREFYVNLEDAQVAAATESAMGGRCSVYVIGPGLELLVYREGRQVSSVIGEAPVELLQAGMLRRGYQRAAGNLKSQISNLKERRAG